MSSKPASKAPASQSQQQAQQGQGKGKSAGKVPAKKVSYCSPTQRLLHLAPTSQRKLKLTLCHPSQSVKSVGNEDAKHKKKKKRTVRP